MRIREIAYFPVRQKFVRSDKKSDCLTECPARCHKLWQTLLCGQTWWMKPENQGKNHGNWMGDHYPSTCLDPDSNRIAKVTSECIINFAIQLQTQKPKAFDLHLNSLLGLSYLSKHYVELPKFPLLTKI